MTMVGSTARPGVRCGDVSEEPRRWLLIAVLVAALVPLTHAVCSAPTDDPRCICRKVYYTGDENDVYIDCKLNGDYSQVPSFRQSNTVYWLTIIRGTSTTLTVQAGAFKILKTKRMLLLSRTNVTFEPGAFSGVGDELEQLIIEDKLDMIPDGAFNGLGQLKYLILDGNRLKTVKRMTFSHLPKLKSLYLRRNQIEAIHNESFDGLSELTILELDKNRLKTVSHRMFSNLSHLEKLSLSQNQLETIPNDVFDGLDKLHFLDLSNNGLKTVSHSMFSHLSRLWHLELDHNQLETIPDDTFIGLGQLTYLELSNNRLTSLNATVVSSLSELIGLKLRDNQLTCDCRLAWIQAKANTIDDVKGVCANPPSARRKSITAYDVSQCKQDTTKIGIVLIFSQMNFKPLQCLFDTKIYLVFKRGYKM